MIAKLTGYDPKQLLVMGGIAAVMRRAFDGDASTAVAYAAVLGTAAPLVSGMPIACFTDPTGYEGRCKSGWEAVAKRAAFGALVYYATKR